MNNIKIIEHNSLACMNHDNLEEIYFCIPQVNFNSESETITLFHSSTGQWEKVKLIPEILELLEHECLHIVLDKIADINTSHKLDNKIKGERLEYSRFKEYWQYIEV